MRIRVVLGDQLFDPARHGPTRGERAFMAEDRELATRFRYHKHKILLFLAAMRSHRDALVRSGVNVRYVSFEERDERPFEDKLVAHCREVGADGVEVFEVSDAFLSRRLAKACDAAGLSLSVLGSPAFLTPRQEFASYLSAVKKPFMKTFYEIQRRRLGLLMKADGKPEGGRFSFDADNREKLPAGLCPPELPRVRHGAHVRAVGVLLDAEMAHHPGHVVDFWLPTTREGALTWFEEFLKARLASFGPYEDALGPHPFVFHSVLSPLLNTGLLTPAEVVEGAVAHAFANGTPLNSLEGFIRQVVGWREFVRGIHDHHGDFQESSNFFDHHGRLSNAWYEGNTGFEPLDEVLAKTLSRGYAHHIERLMILGNVMLLCGIHPREAHRWFMEMFVDSADWVMGPNVFGMSQMSDGGLFATKPYVCGSNYLLKMGPWKKGSWCEALDGLYWGFIARNRDFYASNPRMGMVLGTLDRIDPARSRLIGNAAAGLRSLLVRA